MILYETLLSDESVQNSIHHVQRVHSTTSHERVQSICSQYEYLLVLLPSSFNTYLQSVQVYNDWLCLSTILAPAADKNRRRWLLIGRFICSPKRRAPDGKINELPPLSAGSANIPQKTPYGACGGPSLPMIFQLQEGVDPQASTDATDSAR